MRYTRRVSSGFDVILGAHNETDYGRRGIQYVHYPAYLRPRPDVDMRWYHIGPLLNGYYRVADRIAGFSIARMTSNLTLANSHWTAARILQSMGIHAETLYPPVVAGATPRPWSDRQRSFVAMGRISPEKEYERVIRILARVKKHAKDVSLTIVGTVDHGTRHYMRRLMALIASLDAGSWVSFRHHLPREEVRTLIASTRYGIHGMREEHFGMAPAEMVRGGMLVWVANGGGQVEIVGDAPPLRYDSEEQAADQILAVIGHPQEEQRLRDHLAHYGEQFSVERFMAAIQSHVASFVE
jgi:glycosyltransferase involved in cell wall biosynthesis